MPRTAPDYHLNADWEKILAEAGIEFTTKEQDSATIYLIDCPFCEHGDGKGYISSTTAKFKCHKGCDQLGIDVLVKKDPKWKAKFDAIYKRRRRAEYIPQETVDGYVDMWQRYGDYAYAKALKKSLVGRGVDAVAIKLYQIGLSPAYGKSPARVTIPIYDDAGNCLQIKKYLPSDFKEQWPGATKFLCEVKNNPAYLFPIKQVGAYYTLVLCGGECKAIHAASVLNKHGIGAVAFTGGEEANIGALTFLMEGKEVIICLDADASGRRGTLKACWSFDGVSKVTRVAYLPTELTEKHPKADVNDYINEYGEAAFVGLIASAVKWEKPVIDVSTPYLRQLQNRDNDRCLFEGSQLVDLEDVSPGWFQASDLILNGIYVDIFAVPTEVVVTCSRNDPCCHVCPIINEAPDRRYGISVDRPEIISLIGANAKDEAGQMRKLMGVPLKCSSYKYDTIQQLPVRMCSISPSSPKKQRSMLAVIYSNHEAGNTGVPMDLRGFLSKTMRGTPAFFVTDIVGSDKSIKSFELSEDDERAIVAATRPTDKLHTNIERRYLDLSYNVTQIYNQPDMHLLYDLMFFSAPTLSLQRPFHQTILGTTKVFVVGETGMGKSKTLQSLHQHYGSLGRIIDGPNTTTAGITAGLIKTNEGYKVSLGEFASMHERMIGIEEMSGMHEDVIANIKETLSSGKIKMAKVQSMPDVDANVRVACTSNFVDDVSIIPNSVQQINKLLELFHGQSVLRRFDAGIVTGGEKDTRPTQSIHTLTSEICTKHLKWAWNQYGVKFEDSAIDAVLAAEKKLVGTFDTSIGLVTSGDQRNKVARLSAALALLMFETVVTAAYVEYIQEFLIRIYSTPAFGYHVFTKAYTQTGDIDLETAERLSNTVNFHILRIELLRKRSYTMATVRNICGEFALVVYNGLLHAGIADISNKTDRRGDSICEVTVAGNAYLQAERTKPSYLKGETIHPTE